MQTEAQTLLALAVEQARYLDGVISSEATGDADWRAARAELGQLFDQLCSQHPDAAETEQVLKIVRRHV